MNKGINTKECVMSTSVEGVNTEKMREGKVNLSSLSKMVGFPLDFIKSELLVENNEMTLSDLRSSMTTYLEKVNVEIDSLK